MASEPSFSHDGRLCADKTYVRQELFTFLINKWSEVFRKLLDVHLQHSVLSDIIGYILFRWAVLPSLEADQVLINLFYVLKVLKLVICPLDFATYSLPEM